MNVAARPCSIECFSMLLLAVSCFQVLDYSKVASSVWILEC